MKSTREKFIFYFVAAVTVLSGVIFTSTLVKAAIYDDGVTGLQGIQGAQAAAVSAGVSNSNSSDSRNVRRVPAAVPSEYPAQLVIPSLGIHAVVQELGINTKDNIGVPSNFTDVGWYSYGVVPGKSGTAVIDGHVDNGLGLAGVFKHLSSIQIGDEVDVVTKGGVKLRFVVARVTLYNYQDVPPQAIFGTGSTSSLLNLITCDGTWVSGDDTYNERLVVTAALVP